MQCEMSAKLMPMGSGFESNSFHTRRARNLRSLLWSSKIDSFMRRGLTISGGSTAAVTTAVSPASGAQAAAATAAAQKRRFIAHITRDQGPEYEQSLTFENTTPVSTPTSLKTDRKVTWYQLYVTGRITVGSGAPVTFRSGPAILGGNSGAALFSLIQQLSINGTHATYGALTPILMRGESAAEWAAMFYSTYSPSYRVSINGATPVVNGPLSGAENATNDFEFIIPIPLFPIGINPADQSFYALHGPDWPGNLFISVSPADPTALGVTLASLANGGAVTAYGSASGNGSIDILSERPLVGKALAANIRPAITFRTSVFQQPTQVVQAGGAAGSDLCDLIVGKDTTRILLKAGTQLASTTAGVTTFGTLSDAIVTQTVFSLDSRNLRFQGGDRDFCLQDYQARAYNRVANIGYKVIDFMLNRGFGPGNAKACLPSSKYTAARKLQLNGDVSSASNQLAEVTQELLFGRSGLNKAASGAVAAPAS